MDLQKKLLESINKRIDEASETTYDELSKDYQKKVDIIKKMFKIREIYFWDGIHGIICQIILNLNGDRSYRFVNDDLKKLIKLNIRWIENDGDNISIGL